MASLIINDVVIPPSHIVKLDKYSGEKLTFNWSSMVASTKTIELINVNPRAYDDDYKHSLFSGEWYNRIVVIKDDKDRVLWRGRLKNITKKDKDKKLILTVKNHIQDIIDANVNISYPLEGVATPSEIIHYLLTECAVIPREFIKGKSFIDAEMIEREHNGFIRIKYSEKDNVSASTIIREICRITSSHLYTDATDIIHFYQYTPYNGSRGELITAGDFLEGTYETTYDDSVIYNDYHMAYQNIYGHVAYATPPELDYYLDSRKIFGVKTFQVPDQDITSGEPDAFKILLMTEEGAHWYGDLACERNSDVKKICDLVLTSDNMHLQLNDLIDLTHKSYSRTPLRIIERDPDENAKTIKVKSVFLTPHIREVPLPAAPHIERLQSVGDGNVRIFWTGAGVNISQYHIQFSKMNSFWEGEYAHGGYSPIAVYNPPAVSGVYYYDVQGLGPFTYYFRIIAEDEHMHESKPSNCVQIHLTGGVHD